MKSQWSLSMSYFTKVSQQMLTAIKHVATDNFVLQQDSALVHHAWNTVPLPKNFNNFWQKRFVENVQSEDGIFSHLT